MLEDFEVSFMFRACHTAEGHFREKRIIYIYFSLHPFLY